MVQFSSGCVVSLFILFYVTENKSASYKKSDYKGVIFDKLLSSIANQNEKRMDALKRYIELDNCNVATGILRHASESRKGPLVAILTLNDHYDETNDEIPEKDFTPRKTSVEDIFDILLKGEHFEFDDNEEAKKYLLRSLVENLTYKEMRKNLGRTKGNDIGLLLEPIMSTSTIPISTKNNGKEFDLKKYVIRNNRNEIGLNKYAFKNNGNEFNLNQYTMKNKGDKLNSNKNAIKNSGNEFDSNKYAIKNDGTEIYDDKNGLQMSHSHGNSNLNGNVKDVLRMWEKCTKKAKKMCRKACEGSYKNVCEEYKCSKSMKKDFKKKCKSKCNDQFE